MADNTVLNAGSGGDTIASDDIAGVKHQRVKLSLGADGTAADAPVGGGVEAGTLRVTIASDSTGVLSVDDNGGALTVDGTVELGATTLAALETISVAALPAGSNAIGTVTAVGAAAEDAAVSGNPVLVGGRYDSSARTLETGDAGAIALNASGQVLVEIAAGAGSGGTAAADDADFTAGTTSGTPVMGVYESSPTSVTDGDLGTVGITQTRAMKVAIASGGIVGAVVDSVAGATDEGVLAIAVRDDALATLTPVDGDYTQLRTNARGAQWVALDSTVAQTVTLAAGTATNEVVGDAAQDAAIAGNPVAIGLRASTATPSAMSADGDAVYAWADRNGAQVVVGNVLDDAAFTPGTNRVTPVGYLADETATDSVDEGDIGAARITLDRKQITVPYAHAAGGATPGRLVSAASTNGTVVKASAGTLYALVVMNLNAAVRYLKVYNSASVTVGTTTPTWTFPIPAATTGAGFNVPIPACGIAFGTGICLGITTGVADNDTGAVAANEIIANYAYI